MSSVQSDDGGEQPAPRPAATPSTLISTQLWTLDSLQQWAWQLLRRWGVLFRDLLRKEPGAPPWWRLAPVLRRMEMRGEIRGGRFIRGVGGEQYASGEAVQQLRALRSETNADSLETKSPDVVALSAADPLNLVGVITPHSRLPALATNQFVLCCGEPVADVQGGTLGVYPDCPQEWREAVSAGLVGESEPPAVQTSKAEAEPAPTDDPSSDDSPLEDRHAQRFAKRKKKPPERPRFPRPIIS